MRDPFGIRSQSWLERGPVSLESVVPEAAKEKQHLIPEPFGPRQQRSDRLDRRRSRIEGTQPEMLEQSSIQQIFVRGHRLQISFLRDQSCHDSTVVKNPRQDVSLKIFSRTLGDRRQYFVEGDRAGSALRGISEQRPEYGEG